MSVFILILLLLLTVYAVTLFVFAAAFRRLKGTVGGNDPASPVSIIICARNEQPHLAGCLRSVIAQNYPRELMQVIVVNDASTDSTALVADTALEDSGIDYRIISNPSRKGKKHSISHALRFARHELIVLRDADTYTLSCDWLRQIAAGHESNGGLLIGPVAIKNEPGILAALQALETAVLSVVTGGSAGLGKPFLCNGANLAFPRTVFKRAGGYESHSHLVSGDDIFFLEDVKKLKNVPVTFLKSPDAIVHTYPLRKVGQVLMQKARWASKFRYNPNPLNLWVAFFIFAVNAAFLFAVAGLFVRPVHRDACLIFICLKLAADFILLWIASQFIKPAPAWWRTAVAAACYPVYACAVAVLAIFVKPVWKEE